MRLPGAGLNDGGLRPAGLQDGALRPGEPARSKSDRRRTAWSWTAAGSARRVPEATSLPRPRRQPGQVTARSGLRHQGAGARARDTAGSALGRGRKAASHPGDGWRRALRESRAPGHPCGGAQARLRLGLRSSAHPPTTPPPRPHVHGPSFSGIRVPNVTRSPLTSRLGRPRQPTRGGQRGRVPGAEPASRGLRRCPSAHIPVHHPARSGHPTGERGGSGTRTCSAVLRPRPPRPGPRRPARTSGHRHHHGPAQPPPPPPGTLVLAAYTLAP